MQFKSTQVLSKQILPHISIVPCPKLLSLSEPVITSISPERRNLSISVPVQSEVSPYPRKQHLPRKIPTISFRKFQPLEFVPGARNEDEPLFSSYIDGGLFSTTFVCHFCYDDYSFKSANAIRNHVHAAHRIKALQKLKTNPMNFPRFETMMY